MRQETFVRHLNASLPFDGQEIQLRVNGVDDFLERVGQLHGDWHAGLEKARRLKIPGAVRAADFSHFIGATRRSRKCPLAGIEQEEDASVGPWRSGVKQTARNVCNDTDILALLDMLIYSSRDVMRPAFDWLWNAYFEHLRQQGQTVLVQKLLTHYITRTLTPSGAFHYDSPFRTACDRVQPGSGSGSQSQESWHTHRLRPALENLRAPVEVVVARLTTFFQTRLVEMGNTEQLGDVPSVRFNDEFLREAQNMLSSPFWSSYTDTDDDTTYFAFRAELTTYTKRPGEISVR
jgi:hypothetical protein